MPQQPPLIVAAPGVFSYPLKSPGGWGFLSGGTALLTLGTLIRGPRKDGSVYVLGLAALLIASYLYRIVEDTVGGDDRPPGLKPDEWDGALSALLHYLGGAVVAFLPVLILFVYAISEQKGHLERPDFLKLIGTLLTLGTLYFPMALLLNGFSQRFATAFNFGVGFRGIRTMGFDYAVCCAFFLLTHGTWIALELFWVEATPRGINWERTIAASVTSLSGLYLSAMQMRALGLVYRRHAPALGWKLGDGE